MSDDLYSFQVAVNGVTYTLPAPFSDFAANGWNADSVAPATLDPNHMTLGDPIKDSSGKVVYMTFINMTSDVQNIPQCMVGQVMLDDYDAPKGATLVLPKGITLGSTADEVIAAYGQPSDSYSGDTIKTLTYTQQTYSEVEITVDVSTNKVSQIKVENYNAKSASSSQPASSSGSASQTALPYTPPTDLGSNWDSFNVNYGGALYHLPVPVQVMLSNGWKMVSDPNQTVAAKSSQVGVQLSKDNQTLDTSVRNYLTTGQPVSNCYVTDLKYDINDNAKVPLSLAKGISEKSTEADITAAYGTPTSTDSSLSFKYLTYGTVFQKVTFTIDKSTGKIVAIEVEYMPKTLN